MADCAGRPPIGGEVAMSLDEQRHMRRVCPGEACAMLQLLLRLERGNGLETLSKTCFNAGTAFVPSASLTFCRHLEHISNTIPICIRPAGRMQISMQEPLRVSVISLFRAA